MVYFQTKYPNLGRFWRALEWEMLMHFMTIWNTLRPFDIIRGSLVQFVAIWYIFPILVCLDQEKSGNPEYQLRRRKKELLSIKKQKTE
jgi:hypothetical protein